MSCQVNHKEAISQMELLYQKFYRKLYLYALTLLEHDEAEANDVVSEVFSRIWQLWHEEMQITLVTSNLLYAMVHNRCVDYLRKQNIKARYLQFAQRIDTFVSENDVNEFEERIELLRNAISHLPELDKSILHHCYFKNKTYKETANALGITEVVVHKHMMKVYKELRIMLKNHNFWYRNEG